MIPTELTIVTIGAFVAALNQATKYIGNNFIKRDISKYIPICSVIYGLLLGIIGFYLPNANMGNNIAEAILIGISAGSASTGCHQIVKQLTKPVTSSGDDEKPPPSDEQSTDSTDDNESDNIEN